MIAAAFRRRSETSGRLRRTHLLAIEDDRRLGRVLSRLLTADHHVVEVVTTGSDGLGLADGTDSLDAIVLDIGLPDMSGLDVARRIRRSGNAIPMLILTARDSVRDRVDGLDAGADDYLVKPFAYLELSARLRALVRRAVAPTRTGTCLVAGPLQLDEARHQVSVGGRPITLSAREFALLECLLRSRTRSWRRSRDPPRPARLARAASGS